MSKTATELVQQAKSKIENLSPAQVNEELKNGNALLIDIREKEELEQNGRID